MAAKAELKAVLTLNNVQFLRNIKSAVSSAKAMAAQFARNPFQTTFVAGALATRKAVQVAARGVEFLASVAKVGFIAVGALGAAAAGTMLLLGKAAVDAAAKYEQFQVSFEVLLQSATKASARMKELAEFAQRTPFSLDEVTTASRTLEVLTHGALSTGKGLQLVGDVAAGTLRPIDEMASTIGRLYDAMRSGRPAGESLARLQEIGAVSGEGRTKIEALMSGGRAADAWKAARQELSRYTGLMEKQAGTWTGLMSNFHDAIDGALRAFGAPLIEGLKPTLKLMTDVVSNLGPKATVFGKAFADGIDTGIKLIFAAFENPTSVIEPFAYGLRAAAKDFGGLILMAVNKATGMISAPSFFGNLAEAFIGLGEVMRGVVINSFRVPLLDSVTKTAAKLYALYSIPIALAQGVSPKAAITGVKEQWKDINTDDSQATIQSGLARMDKATNMVFHNIATGLSSFSADNALGAGSDWAKAKAGFKRAVSAGAGALTTFTGAQALGTRSAKLFEVYRKPGQHMAKFGGELLNNFDTSLLASKFVSGSLGSTGGLGASARRTTSLVPLSERRAIQDAQIGLLAEKGIFSVSGSRTARDHDAVRRGDRERRKEGEREAQRKALGETTDSETLKAIRAKFDQVAAAII